MKLNLGYCCLSQVNPKLRCNRASTKTYLEKHTAKECHDYLLEKALANIRDLKLLLHQNAKNDILAYRLSEQILPQLDLGYYTLSEVKQELKKVGELANSLGMQLSTHPSQYFVLNSLREDVVKRSIFTLNLFGEMFSLMELEKTPNITLHVGMKNGYEQVTEAIDAFCNNFETLNSFAKKYLVVENDHVSFTIEHCMMIHDSIHIPVVFDNMHYKWNPGNLTYKQAVNLAVHTWGNRTPKVHLSSDREEKKHAHAEIVTTSDYLELKDALEFANIKECNVMLECKQKDLGVLKLREALALI